MGPNWVQALGLSWTLVGPWLGPGRRAKVLDGGHCLEETASREVYVRLTSLLLALVVGLEVRLRAEYSEPSLLLLHQLRDRLVMRCACAPSTRACVHGARVCASVRSACDYVPMFCNYGALARLCGVLVWHRPCLFFQVGDGLRNEPYTTRPKLER